jgi:MerT mercuric transport protein
MRRMPYADAPPSGRLLRLLLLRVGKMSAGPSTRPLLPIVRLGTTENLDQMTKLPVVMGSSVSAIGSSVLATVTSLCCIGPAVFAILGTSGALAAARLAPYRPYFIVGSVVLLGIGFWLGYRPQSGCIGKSCTTRTAKFTRALLWLAAVLTIVAIVIPNFIHG